MMILLSESLAYLIPLSYGGLTMLLLSSRTDTFNNNFGDSFYSIYHKWICKDNHFLLKIENLMMLYNPIVKVLFDWLVGFCIAMAL